MTEIVDVMPYIKLAAHPGNFSKLVNSQVMKYENRQG